MMGEKKLYSCENAKKNCSHQGNIDPDIHLVSVSMDTGISETQEQAEGEQKQLNSDGEQRPLACTVRFLHVVSTPSKELAWMAWIS